MSAKGFQQSSLASVVIAVIASIAALRFGSELLIPFALAVLFSFLLAPLVIFLQRRLGRIISVILVTATVFTILAAVGWLVAGQVAYLANELPAYRENIRVKIKSLRESAQSTFGRATQAVKEISVELDDEPEIEGPIKPNLLPPESSATMQRDTPSFVAMAASWIGSFMARLAEAAVVIVLVIFMLLYFEDLRDRFLKLIGTSRLNETTQALDDAARRVSRYLLMQTVINASNGICVGAGMFFLGIPAALFWGINSALLRYVPYIGPLIAAALPIGLSLAVSETWTLPLLTIGFFVTLEIVSNNVLEPWLYGSSTGLSPIAVIVAAIFWTWLWGGVGLVLSAPLTVCLVVLGKHVAQLQFINILLSDQPVLVPKDRLYQRLLAMDHEAALVVAEKYMGSRSLEEVFDQLLIPTLAMAKVDLHEGDLEETRRKFIHDSMKTIIEELCEADLKRESAGKSPEEKPVFRSSKPVTILCLPAQDDADELAGLMFTQLLERDGHHARCLSKSALSGEALDLVQKEGAQIVCVSALPPSAIIYARYLRKRIRARFEKLNIVIGLWTHADDPHRMAERVELDPLVHGVTTLAAGREFVRQLAETFTARSSAPERRAE